MLTFGQAVRAVSGVLLPDLLCKLPPLSACPCAHLYSASLGLPLFMSMQRLILWSSEVSDTQVLLSSSLKQSCKICPTCLLCDWSHI